MTAATVWSLIAFVLLGSSSFAALTVYSACSPDTARARLTTMRKWIDVNRQKLLMILFLAIGTWLIVQSSYSLITA